MIYKCKTLLIIAVMLFCGNAIMAQGFKQTVRGTVVDNITKSPLIGVNVVVLDSGAFMGAATDIDGTFRINDVPVGRSQLRFSYMGYKEVIIPIIINSAKENVLSVEMNESVITTQAVVITANRDKDKTNNEMAVLSSRMFSIEETNRYAGSRGDPARMAMNYAGVSGANDQRNDIIIRGNTPSGLLWRIDDMDIPNPNHFAAQGTTGGPVSILNNNTLKNSDFITGAFPAEYGNALSGVFDLKMRNGNNEKLEFTGQIGFNGLELGIEGPISKKNKSSYLANYRFSTLDFVYQLGMSVGTSGVPKYQDFTYKVNVPVKSGIISWFGIAGKSSIAMLDSKKDEADLYSESGTDIYNRSDLLTSGLSYTHFHKNKGYSKFLLSGFYENGGTDLDTLDLHFKPSRFYREDYANQRYSANYLFSKKINIKLSTKSGVSYDRLMYSLQSNVFDFDYNDFRKLIDYKNDFNSGLGLYRAYSQWLYKINDNLSINPGVHFMYFDLTSDYAVEPRAGVSWNFAPSHRLSAGYGLHSKIQPLSAYFMETRIDAINTIQTNKNLKFSKAHHYAVAYDWSISEYVRFKSELYYQDLFNIPVEKQLSSYSMLNTGAGWGVDIADSLVNKGTGKNYGVEFTLEKFFHKNYYYLLTVSLFESKYVASDGKEYNTAFNGNYVLNALLGKEFVLNQKTTLYFDIKSTYAGGKRYSPIDIEASKATESTIWTTVYDETKAFSLQQPAYFKTDFKLGIRKEGKKVSQEWSWYVENITNHKNLLYQSYDKKKGEVQKVYQLGFFPMAYYRIYF